MYRWLKMTQRLKDQFIGTNRGEMLQKGEKAFIKQ